MTEHASEELTTVDRLIAEAEERLARQEEILAGFEGPATRRVKVSG
jgi:hypothetical protein